MSRELYRIVRARFGDKTHVMTSGGVTTMCGFWTRGQRIQEFDPGTEVTCEKCAPYGYLVSSSRTKPVKGVPYGSIYITPEGKRISMRKDGWSVTFYDENGEKVGSTQSTPWLAEAYAKKHGWRLELTPNARYYVWVVDRNGTPIEGPYGPHDLDAAKTYARIAATEGKNDRAVSRGRDPKVSSFVIVRRYRARTGERVI